MFILIPYLIASLFLSLLAILLIRKNTPDYVPYISILQDEKEVWHSQWYREDISTRLALGERSIDLDSKITRSLFLLNWKPSYMPKTISTDYVRIQKLFSKDLTKIDSERNGFNYQKVLQVFSEAKSTFDEEEIQ